MKTIVVNGANGYVASHFISDLLKNKYKVVALVRPNHQSPAERMKNVLEEIDGGENVDMSNLKVFGYSLNDIDFSIPKDDLKEIFRDEVDYFHFAASLKYDKKSAKEIFSTNVEGVENSVKIFSEYASASSRFFYIGTAYSCGKFEGTFEEKFYPNEDISYFRNYYEQSKRFAENIVKENVLSNKLNAHIIRLSQVVGNHTTGITLTDYGIFDFAKRIHNLAKRYPNEVVRIHVDPSSSQNLIPVDTVTKHLTKVVGEAEVPEIMNFVSNKSVLNNHIIETLNKMISIRLIPLKKLKRETMNPIERLVSVGMSFSDSYTETNISFDSRQRDEFTNNSETGPDNDSVTKMLTYFIEKISDKRIKQKSTVA